MNELNINFDAWSQGQIKSKLWLCEALEKYYTEKAQPTIWILGGWYGLLAFLIFSRGRLNPALICQFDLDEGANSTALKINNNWIANGLEQFKVFHQDASQIDYHDSRFGSAPDIVINTSCEHFEKSWAHLIPSNTYVIAQSTNMKHNEHINCAESLSQFHSQLQSHIEIQHQAQMDFNYPQLVFSRFMILGRKI